MRKYIFFPILLALISLVSADVISINTGGSTQTISNSDTFIESFFSGGIVGNATTTSTGSGGVEVSAKNPQYINVFFPRIWTKDKTAKIKVQAIDNNGNIYQPLNMDFIINFTGIGIQSQENKSSGEIETTFSISKNTPTGNQIIRVIVQDERTIYMDLPITIERPKSETGTLQSFLGFGGDSDTPFNLSSAIYKLIITIFLIILLILFIVMVIQLELIRKRGRGFFSRK